MLGCREQMGEAVLNGRPTASLLLPDALNARARRLPVLPEVEVHLEHLPAQDALNLREHWTPPDTGTGTPAYRASCVCRPWCGLGRTWGSSG